MRIAIVNNMLLAVEALRRVVTSVPDYEIAWVARNGAEAVEKCAADTPDVVRMGLIMPVMDGVEATRRIMAASPCLILVVTATGGGNAAKVFEAMGYGARDVVNTPVLGGMDGWRAEPPFWPKSPRLGNCWTQSPARSRDTTLLPQRKPRHLISRRWWPLGLRQEAPRPWRTFSPVYQRGSPRLLSLSNMWMCSLLPA
jgi:two-component system response regulator WspF